MEYTAKPRKWRPKHAYPKVQAQTTLQGLAHTRPGDESPDGMIARVKERARWITLVSSAVIALALGACSNVPTAHPTSITGKSSLGVLVPKSATVDLGNVPFDVQADGRFDLVNSGSQPVKLVSVPQVKMLEGC
jgi:hypothetical protein